MPHYITGEKMNIEQLENFLASAHSYAETTKRTYRDVIPRILDQVEDPASLTAAELIRLLGQSGWGNSRQCVALAAIQKYLAWKYKGVHPALAAKIKRVKGKVQRALDPETALKLLLSFDTFTPKGARDIAMCSLMLDTGLRESEVCRLQLADTDLDRRTLQVIVKGGQWKAGAFGHGVAMNVDRWLHYRRIADGENFLFTHIKTGHGLTPEGLYMIVKQWGLKIGIKLSPHDLRRSMAVMGTMYGAPERSLMEMGRWESSDMIKRYTRTLMLEQVRQYLPVDRLLGGPQVPGDSS
jgi:integrase/recombinase XerD